MPKQYADADFYERKLHNIMDRMGANELNYNFDRHGGWVEFKLNSQLYRFDHDKEKAAARGIKLAYGSDCFAQIVLSLEDLARMAERGIYELSTWLAGLKFLPPPVVVPECIKGLGFTEIPSDVEEINLRYRLLAKRFHPDAGGSEADFTQLQKNAEEAIHYMEARK